MTGARRYLLDTNILSDLVRRPQGAVAGRLARVGEGAVCTSIVVAAELRFGALKSGSKRLQRQALAFLLWRKRKQMVLSPWNCRPPIHLR